MRHRLKRVTQKDYIKVCRPLNVELTQPQHDHDRMQRCVFWHVIHMNSYPFCVILQGVNIRTLLLHKGNIVYYFN